jgi:hypothetical protein
MSEKRGLRRSCLLGSLAALLLMAILLSQCQLSAEIGGTSKLQMTVEALAAMVEGLEEAEPPAETLTSRPERTPTPAPTDTGPSNRQPYFLEGGVAITYQMGEVQGIFMQPVDDLMVYRTFNDFAGDWVNSYPNRPAIVEWALISTTQEANWQFYYAKPVGGKKITPTAWYEYAQAIQLAETDTFTSTGEFQQFFGPELAISPPAFSCPNADAGSISNSLNQLSNCNANLAMADRFLIAEEHDGDIHYTLVLFDPTAGAGGNWLREWCLRCRYGYCRGICSALYR